MEICNHCGCVYDYNEFENDCCPNCHAEGEHEEAFQCEICGNYVADEDFEYGYCKECFEKLKDDYRHDLAGLRAITDEYDNIEVNSLYTFYFDKADIDQILFNELQKRKEQDYADFIDDARDYLMENYKKEVGKCEK